MMIQKSKDKPLQFDANLEKIIIRTFEKRSKNVRKIGVVKGRDCIYIIYRVKISIKFIKNYTWFIFFILENFLLENKDNFLSIYDFLYRKKNKNDA